MWEKRKEWDGIEKEGKESTWMTEKEENEIKWTHEEI